MPRLVALLGGINVGGHRVTMDRLRAEVTSLGYTDVATFIASGNVLFTAPGRLVRGGAPYEAILSEHLAARFGWPVPTFVRPASELLRTVDLRPFGATPGGHTHMVAFRREVADPALIEALAAAASDHDRFEAHGREVHWLIRGGLMQSTITLPRLAKLIGPNTTRNITSLERLAGLLNRAATAAGTTGS